MPKCALVSRLLQLRLTSCAACALGLVAVVQLLTSHGAYDYVHSTRETLLSELYTETSPTLVLKKSNRDCKYDDILSSSHTVDPREVPTKFDDFSVSGLGNGTYTPEDCNPMFSVAILVPYRNRQSQLDVFLPYMHNFLRKQRIHYRIYLVEQQDEHPWNKGLLYNIGAKIAIADKFPCLILHDVDLLPLDDSNLYVCMKEPRHMSASIDMFRFMLIYDYLVGGVLAIRSDQFESLNGFSNKFMGWGGEDDDFAQRIFDHNLKILRFPREMSRYTALPHELAPRNGERLRVLAAGPARAGVDGLNSARHAGVVRRQHRLFTLLGARLPADSQA